jgi:hypothetical protein
MFMTPRRPPTEPMSTMAPPSSFAFRCRIAGRTVRKTPLRLISIMSSHIGSEISSAGANDATPALATTTSSRPSSATPSSTACCMAALSRTSARRARMRRPTFSTTRTVSSMSSWVAIG